MYQERGLLVWQTRRQSAYYERGRGLTPWANGDGLVRYSYRIELQNRVEKKRSTLMLSYISRSPRRKAQYTSTHQQPQCCYPVLSHCCVADTDPRYCWWHGRVALPRFLFPSLRTTPLRRHAVRPSPRFLPQNEEQTRT